MGVIATSGHRDYTIDAENLLKDAGAVTATGAAQVGGSDAVLDFGGEPLIGQSADQVAYVRGHVVVEVDAVDVADADESYDIVYQLSDDADFTAGNVVARAALHLGTAQGPDGDPAAGTGRVVIGVDNEFQGQLFRFARIAHVIAGTTPSISYRAFLGQGL